MKNIFRLNSSLSEHIVSSLRNENTGHRCFLKNMERLSILLTAEAVKDLETETITIKTPIKETRTQKIKNQVTVVSILRAGLSFSQQVYELINNSKIGHIGVYRDEEDENKRTIQYLEKLPSSTNGSDVFICDPMIGTGNTLMHCINLLKDKYAPNRIKVLSAIAYKDSLEKLAQMYSDVEFYVAAIDNDITSSKYISPGLGDAGDRSFGTRE